MSAKEYLSTASSTSNPIIFPDLSRSIFNRGRGQLCKLIVDLLNGLDRGFYRFSHNVSAIFLVIPACLHIEFNVPCEMLLLFRGTITTLILPLYHPSKMSSFPCLLNVTPSWFNTHATSLLDKFLSILEAQRNSFKTFLLQRIFRK